MTFFKKNMHLIYAFLISSFTLAIDDGYAVIKSPDLFCKNSIKKLVSSTHKSNDFAFMKILSDLELVASAKAKVKIDPEVVETRIGAYLQDIEFDVSDDEINFRVNPISLKSDLALAIKILSSKNRASGIANKISGDFLLEHSFLKYSSSNLESSKAQLKLILASYLINDAYEKFFLNRELISSSDIAIRDKIFEIAEDISEKVFTTKLFPKYVLPVSIENIKASIAEKPNLNHRKMPINLRDDFISVLNILGFINPNPDDITSTLEKFKKHEQDYTSFNASEILKEIVFSYMFEKRGLDIPDVKNEISSLEYQFFLVELTASIQDMNRIIEYAVDLLTKGIIETDNIWAGQDTDWY